MYISLFLYIFHRQVPLRCSLLFTSCFKMKCYQTRFRLISISKTSLIDFILKGCKKRIEHLRGRFGCFPCISHSLQISWQLIGPVLHDVTAMLMKNDSEIAKLKNLSLVSVGPLLSRCLSLSLVVSCCLLLSLGVYRCPSLSLVVSRCLLFVCLHLSV